MPITHLSSAVSLCRKPKSAVYSHSSSWRDVAKLSWASRHVHFGEAYFAGVKGKSFFYGVGCQDALPLHTESQRNDSRRPGLSLSRMGPWSAVGSARTSVSRSCSGRLLCMVVLRVRAGTILLLGTLWPIASFGSPGGHSLSRGTAADRPGPEIPWMLSPLSVECPDRAIVDRRHHVPSERSKVRLGCVSEFLRVVHLH